MIRWWLLLQVCIIIYSYVHVLWHDHDQYEQATYLPTRLPTHTYTHTQHTHIHTHTHKHTHACMHAHAHTDTQRHTHTHTHTHAHTHMVYMYIDSLSYKLHICYIHY